MGSSKKRIYVGNLPYDITESELSKKFSKYGKVHTLELKYRTSDNEVGLPCYAFLDLETDDVDRCFRKIAKKVWRGNTIKLELAKESFLSRLKKERLNDPAPSSLGVVHSPDVSHAKRRKSEVTDLNGSSNRNSIYFNDSGQQNVVTKFSTNDLLPEKTKNVLKLQSSRKDIPSKKSENQINSENMKDTGTNGLSEKKSKLDASASEKKRLKSLEEKSKSFFQQKEAVKLALSTGTVDANRKAIKKVIFDDDGNAVDTTMVLPEVSARKPIESRNKSGLFGDDESADEGVPENNFEIKRQFEGKRGHKLLQLQSNYANDQRFALDERFHESDNEDYHDTNPKRAKMSQPEHEGFNNFMLRFDPSIADHKKFEGNQNKRNATERQKNKRQSVDEKDGAVRKNAPPVVSTEKFYKVADNLKETLKSGENQSFSLLEMFGSNTPKEPDVVVEAKAQQYPAPRAIGKPTWTSNPFRYDSSESETEEQVVPSLPHQQPSGNVISLWKKESFFFKTDDERFAEGLDFFAKPIVTEDFGAIRDRIKRVISHKMNHQEYVQQKHKPTNNKPTSSNHSKKRE